MPSDCSSSEQAWVLQPALFFSSVPEFCGTWDHSSISISSSPPSFHSHLLSYFHGQNFASPKLHVVKQNVAASDLRPDFMLKQGVESQGNRKGSDSAAVALRGDLQNALEAEKGGRWGQGVLA